MLTENKVLESGLPSAGIPWVIDMTGEQGPCVVAVIALEPAFLEKLNSTVEALGLCGLDASPSAVDDPRWALGRYEEPFSGALMYDVRANGDIQFRAGTTIGGLTSEVVNLRDMRDVLTDGEGVGISCKVLSPAGMKEHLMDSGLANLASRLAGVELEAAHPVARQAGG
jgi:hypothetical protein